MRRAPVILRHLTGSSLNESGSRGVAIIVGAGDATGAAATRAFASEGYVVVPIRRNKGASTNAAGSDGLDTLVKSLVDAGHTCRGFAIDARREDEVRDMLDTVETELGPVTACVHNIGPNVFSPVVDTTTQRYLKMFEISAGSALVVGREVAKRMLARGEHTTATRADRSNCIFFTGATASTRGAAGFAAFSGAMAAKRMLAQSMSRELAPQGIHVAHVVVDGVIDTPFHASDRSPVPRDRYAELVSSDGLIDPDAIGAAFVMLANQPRSAWTFELDLRPWCEKW